MGALGSGNAAGGAWRGQASSTVMAHEQAAEQVIR
jgi:hypothetical protein